MIVPLIWLPEYSFCLYARTEMHQSQRGSWHIPIVFWRTVRAHHTVLVRPRADKRDRDWPLVERASIEMQPSEDCHRLSARHGPGRPHPHHRPREGLSREAAGNRAARVLQRIRHARSGLNEYAAAPLASHPGIEPIGDGPSSLFEMPGPPSSHIRTASEVLARSRLDIVRERTPLR